MRDFIHPLRCLRALDEPGVDLIWRQIVADVLDLPVNILQTEQGPSLGGALLAMVGAGEYPSVEAAAAACVRVSETVMPDPAAAAKYEDKYRTFARLYPALKAVR